MAPVHTPYAWVAKQSTITAIWPRNVWLSAVFAIRMSVRSSLCLSHSWVTRKRFMFNISKYALHNIIEIYSFLSHILQSWTQGLFTPNDCVEEQHSVGRYHRTTVVPQYHKYRGTTVRYLPTNSHFSEDLRAMQFIDRVNKLEVFKLKRSRFLMQLIFDGPTAQLKRDWYSSAALCYHVGLSDIKSYFANYRPTNAGHQSPIAVSESFLDLQYQMRQWHLTKDVFRSLAQAYIHCRLQYCNAVLAGTADTVIKRLQ